MLVRFDVATETFQGWAIKSGNLYGHLTQRSHYAAGHPADPADCHQPRHRGDTTEEAITVAHQQESPARKPGAPFESGLYHDAIARHDQLVVDFSDCYYIDPEGPRWLASVKADQVQFVDRRSRPTGAPGTGLPALTTPVPPSQRRAANPTAAGAPSSDGSFCSDV